MRWPWGALAIFVCCGSAHAQPVTEIWRCVDGDGKRHYTNSRKDKETAGMKCELVTSQINVAPPLTKPPPRGSFPRESAKDSASAKERQREILQRELAAEEVALSKAKQALAEGEATRTGDERNYARVLERLQPLKESVENHEKNIAALKRELANLYR